MQSSVSVWLASPRPCLVSLIHHLCSPFFLPSFFFFSFLSFFWGGEAYFTYALQPVKKIRSLLHILKNKEGKKQTLVNNFHFECLGWLQGPGDQSAECGRMWNHLSWENHCIKGREGRHGGKGRLC